MMNIKNKWFWISPIIFGISVLGIIRLVNDIPKEEKFWERPLSANIIELISIILISFAVECFLHYFVKHHNLKTNKLSIKQLITEYLLIMLFSITITAPCLYFIHFLIHQPVSLDDFVIAEIVMTLLLLIYYSIFRGRDLLMAYVNQKTLTQQIKNTQMETELKFLKAQFHPHFLFNALNTIYFQIEESNKTPRKLIEQLSELLRYQLYDFNQTVVIKQELNYIINYIKFQKVRMNDSFHLAIEIDPHLSDQQIQPLLLFPLVENAYKYIGGEYWITIKAYLNDGHLDFTVKNAIPQLAQAKNIKSSGIGLINLKRRLDLLYPDRYLLETIKSNNSFTANLKIEW